MLGIFWSHQEIWKWALSVNLRSNYENLEIRDKWIWHSNLICSASYSSKCSETVNPKPRYNNNYKNKNSALKKVIRVIQKSGSLQSYTCLSITWPIKSYFIEVNLSDKCFCYFYYNIIAKRSSSYNLRNTDKFICSQPGTFF